MIGPYPRGHWMNHNPAEPHGILIPGHRYRVTKPFTDFDKHQHPTGETWTYLGYSFLPYDDGLSLFVSLDGDQEWHMRMQWRAEEQAFIIENLHEYILEISPKR